MPHASDKWVGHCETIVVICGSDAGSSRNWRESRDTDRRGNYDGDYDSSRYRNRSDELGGGGGGVRRIEYRRPRPTSGSAALDEDSPPGKA